MPVRGCWIRVSLRTQSSLPLILERHHQTHGLARGAPVEALGGPARAADDGGELALLSREEGRDDVRLAVRHAANEQRGESMRRITSRKAIASGSMAPRQLRRHVADRGASARSTARA